MKNNQKSLQEKATQTKCRPMMITSYQLFNQPHQYIKLPYNYNVKQLKNIEDILCSCVKIIGIDFEKNIEEIPIVKNKKIFIQGIQNNSKVVAKFGQVSNYHVVQWVVDVAVPIWNQEKSRKQDFQNALIDSIVLVCKNQDGQQQLIDTEYISNSTLKKAKLLHLCHQSKQSTLLKPKIKVLTNRIPVMIILPKLENYNRLKIISIICDDIISAINVMVDNQMMYRTVQKYLDVLPIQNYSKKFGEKDEWFQRFVKEGKQSNVKSTKNEKKSILSMQIQKLQQQANKQAQFQQQQIVHPPQVSSKQKSNRETLKLAFLIVILMMVVIGYVSFKLM